MKHKLPRKLRRLRRTEAISVGEGEILTTGDLIYYDGTSPTVTFPSGIFDSFSVGDVITINSSQVARKKNKVHVARRRKQKKLVTHTITNIGPTAMTIAVNDLTTATKISNSRWAISTGITLCAE